MRDLVVPDRYVLAAAKPPQPRVRDVRVKDHEVRRGVLTLRRRPRTLSELHEEVRFHEDELFAPAGLFNAARRYCPSDAFDWERRELGLSHARSYFATSLRRSRSWDTPLDGY